MKSTKKVLKAEKQTIDDSQHFLFVPLQHKVDGLCLIRKATRCEENDEEKDDLAAAEEGRLC